MSTVELTKDNFNTVINENDTVLVDLWAPWCAPCRSFAPTFEAAAQKHPEAVFGKVNVDKEQELADFFRARSIPTLVVIRQKIGVFYQSGALPSAALEDVIQQAMALDMDKIREELANPSDTIPDIANKGARIRIP